MNIFVFGSNLAGRHGKGAALHARKHCGAVYGQGSGLQGASYAIPTKSASLESLSLCTIAQHVEVFCAFVHKHPEHTYQITRVGCGLAGYKDSDIAPMFKGLRGLPNVTLPEGWKGER